VAAVKVLYFAKVRDLVGCAEEELVLPNDLLTVSEFALELQKIRPALLGKLVSVRIAVNESFANADTEIRGGDVVALIPPVAGG
jgi:molybdopterin converting factor subunit 1